MERKTTDPIRCMEDAFIEDDWETVRELAEHALRADAEDAVARHFLRLSLLKIGKTNHANTELGEHVATMFGAGRYVVIGPMAEIGNNQAFRCRDVALGRDVALMRFDRYGLRASLPELVTEDRQFLQRLNTHPNIMSVYDLIEDVRRQYLVTELVEIPSLESMLSGADGAELPFYQVIEIGKAICSALEHAHSKSIIHVGLNASNVRFADGKMVKVEGFNVFAKPTADKLRSGVEDDLIALGTLIRRIFFGNGTDSLARCGNDERGLNRLENVLSGLLVSRRCLRYKSAAEVFALLDSIQTDAQIDGKEGAGAGEIIRREFVGRKREIDCIKAAFEEAVAGHGRVIFLAGEPGIGKTRTAEELSPLAASREALVLWGRIHEEPGAPPFSPWVQVIRSYINSVDSDELTRSLEPTHIERKCFSL